MNRGLFFSIVASILFSLGVIVWFFVFARPEPAPTLGENFNPLPTERTPVRFQFLNFNRDDEEEAPQLSTTEVTPIEKDVLTNIWKNPTAGATFAYLEILRQEVSTTTEGTTTVLTSRFVRATGTVLMFVDRTTGHIYGYNRESGKVYQISNTTIPGVHDAYIFNNGRSVVFRYADQERGVVVGALATVPSVAEDRQAEPLQRITYLPSEVASVAVNKNKTELSYLVSNNVGSSIYTLSGDRGASLVATSPFREWLLSYGETGELYATTKPSAYVVGHTVKIPSFGISVGEKTGLMSNPGIGGYILNSVWTDSGLKTFLSNGGTESILSIATLAPKCVWGDRGLIYCGVPETLPLKKEGLPDDWLQGTVSFTDKLVAIDPLRNTSYVLSYLETSDNLAFDVTGMATSQDDLYIAFIRKQDGSLWLYDTTIYEE